MAGTKAAETWQSQKRFRLTPPNKALKPDSPLITLFAAICR